MTALLDDQIFIDVAAGIAKSLIQEGMASTARTYTTPFEFPDLLKGSSPDELWISAGDTVIELGHPLTESICLGLLTQQPNLIEDGRVTVLGTELKDLLPGRHSIALMIMVEARELNEETRYELARRMSVCSDLVGCMTRVISGRIWIRLNHEALRRGLSLSLMGWHIISELRKEDDKFNAVEVLFVVSDREQIDRFRPVAGGYAERSRIRFSEEIKKRADCENPFDCDECPDTVTCQVFKDAVMIARTKERMS